MHQFPLLYICTSVWLWQTTKFRQSNGKNNLWSSHTFPDNLPFYVCGRSTCFSWIVVVRWVHMVCIDQSQWCLKTCATFRLKHIHLPDINISMAFFPSGKDTPMFGRWPFSDPGNMSDYNTYSYQDPQLHVRSLFCVTLPTSTVGELPSFTSNLICKLVRVVCVSAR